MLSCKSRRSISSIFSISSTSCINLYVRSGNKVGFTFWRIFLSEIICFPFFFNNLINVLFVLCLLIVFFSMFFLRSGAKSKDKRKKKYLLPEDKKKEREENTKEGDVGCLGGGGGGGGGGGWESFGLVANFLPLRAIEMELIIAGNCK